MMKKLYLIFLVSLLCVFGASAEKFDDFKSGTENSFEDEKNSFGTYKNEIEAEFKAYKLIAEDEFKKYKADILLLWNQADVSTPTKWVEYTEGMKFKKTVDFENGTFTLEVVGKDFDSATKDLDKLMRDMLTESRKTAFERDTPSKNTDLRARKELKNIAFGDVGDESFIGSAVTGKSKLTEKDVDNAVKALKNGAVVSTEPSKNGDKIYIMKGKLPSETYKRKADELAPYVKKYSQEFKIDSSLVFSVIQTESAFNPAAQSYVPAYGLMQIVPSTAGKDVAQMLMGKPLILTPSYLFNEENNIRVGTAYLNILYYKYLKDVNHPESRLYCSIAAYNTGAGNVASAFNGGSNAGASRYNVTNAAGLINGMKPQEVYDFLRFKLEYDEARRYIVKVNTALPSYKYYD